VHHSRWPLKIQDGHHWNFIFDQIPRDPRGLKLRSKVFLNQANSLLVDDRMRIMQDGRLKSKVVAP
jgi:hypothetical protein